MKIPDANSLLTYRNWWRYVTSLPGSYYILSQFGKHFLHDCWACAVAIHYPPDVWVKSQPRAKLKESRSTRSCAEKYILSEAFFSVYSFISFCFEVYMVIKHDRTQTALTHDWRNQSSWNKFEHAAKVTTYALVYINEVLPYQFVHRKIRTLTFETHHVHTRVNQKQGFLFLFMWIRRSKQAVVQRNSSTLSCDSCGHKTRNPWTWTDCGPVWKVNYYNQTALAVEPWVRKLLDECQGEGRALPSVLQISSSMTLTETSTKICERTHVYRWSSLICLSACRKSDDTV
jgi:hypothetical protein